MRYRLRQIKSGKRAEPTPVISAVGSQNGSLLLVTDSKSKEQWLVDTGAAVSIIPATPEQKSRGPTGAELKAANSTPISTYGRCYHSLFIANRRFDYEFIIADVRHRILGSDFLSDFYLAPNLRDATLLDLETFDTLPANFAEGVSNPIFHVEANNRFYQLLDQFPAISTPSFTTKQPQHGVKHFIPTEGPPVQSRARKLAPDRLAIAKAEIQKYLDLGICYRGKSEWTSPLMVAPKPGGGWRVCGDYRRLNAVTKDDKYPVRTLSDFTADLHGKKVFSKIDLFKGYHQIPVNDSDIGKTGVITPFGLFVFPRTPFGLKNAGQDFQRLMDEILGDVPHVFVYIDDILIASESYDEHYEDLKRVCEILEKHGMVINRAKCILGVSKVEFLGYQVDQNGITPLQDRVIDIKNTPAPTTVKELQSFLGMINYYRRFLPNAAHHLTPLFDALKGKPKKIDWSRECQNGFDAIKAALVKATLLHHPKPSAPLALTTDASNFAIGGVLEQRGRNGWEPLAFYSAKLQEHQRLWPPYDRELLAAFKATRHFRSMLEGRAFTLYTDHQSLIPSMSKKSEPQTARQAYQLSCISEFTTDIRYLEGKANVVADALSRPPQTAEVDYGISNIFHDGNQLNSREQMNSSFTSDPNPVLTDEQRNNSPTTTVVPISSASQVNVASTTASDSNPGADEQMNIESRQISSDSNVVDVQQVNIADSNTTNSPQSTKEHDISLFVNAIGPLGLDLSKMAADQPLDRDFVRLSNDARAGLNFKRVSLDGVQLIVDVSNGPARPFVPFNWRRKVFETIHNLGHPGVERTRQTIADKFFWPSMREDSSRWARECQPCQLAKINRHTTPPIGEFTVPERRFSHLNVDLVGPLPVSNGFRYLLTAVDRFTRWPIAIPIKDITAESVIDAFAHGWISHFGIPASITTDRGSQFSSAIWTQLMQTWSIKTHTTTPYHPASNGLVERFHRRLKESLIALSEQQPVNWFWSLPCTLLCIRTTLKPDIGASPADLVYGEGLSVPGSLIPSNDNADNDTVRRTLEHLRLEVARLQPTHTSAHRVPRVHIPGDLERASHVFVLRGGHQPSLSSPYVGPFRVVSRGRESFRIALPGRGVDSINIARLKPAVVAEDDDAPPPETPPSPPPPGRRPGPRTRPPAPTDRNMRRRVRFDDQLPSTSNDSTASSTPVVRHPLPDPPAPSVDDAVAIEPLLDEDPVLDAPAPPVVDERPPRRQAPPVVDERPPREHAPTAMGSQASNNPPRFFTRPNQRTFSRQRPTTSYGDVLNVILQRHVTNKDVISSSSDS